MPSPCLPHPCLPPASGPPAPPCSTTIVTDTLSLPDPPSPSSLFPPCSTTIVTDTPEQAREVAFGSAQRQKVVALDGTIINKAGIITGGMHSGLEARAGQWDQGALDEMKQASGGVVSV